MRFLRTLLNCVLAGGLMAAYVTILFLQLNPAVPIGPAAIGPLALALWLSYGVHVAVLFYAGLVLRQLFAEDPLSPGWVSVKLLAWLCACCAVFAGTITWLNLRNFRLSLTEDAARAMALGAATLTICAVLFVLLAAFRYSVGRRGRAIGGWLLVAIAVASLGGPLWWRGAGDGQPPPAGGIDPAHAFTPRSGNGRVILILLDGASLDFISPAAADGRLPNFGRVLDTGAVMHLATLRPTQAAPVWTSVATGKLPPKTGVRSASTFRPFGSGLPIDLLPDYCFAHALVSVGLFSEAPLDSSSVRSPAVWQILGASGIASGIVRWPLTYPAHMRSGVLVSDRFHRAGESAAGLDDLALTSPADVVDEGVVERARAQEPLLPALPRARFEAVSGPIAADGVYAAVFDRLSDRRDLHFVAVRYQGLDAIGHTYLREAMPRAFGDVAETERRQYGRVLEQYYRYVDGRVGAAIEQTGPDDLLLIVSGFGMQPLSMAKRVLERALGNTSTSGTHERAPDGFLLAWGRSVRAGRYPRAAVVDVTPTLLYFFGLPIGRDMDGFARTDIFTRPFTEDRPLSFIRSYER